MKTYRKELWFNTPARRQFINITSQVRQCLAESGIKEGFLLCNAMHITASVFINDDESGLHHDFEVWLEKLAPEKPYSQYRHNGAEDNADAHLKRTIMGREVVFAVTDGRLIEPKDVEQLTNACAELIENKELINKLGKAGREFVKQKFAPNTMVDIIEKIYNNRLSNTNTQH